ncbi:MAG: alpha/beta fold hydrolase [Actinomycetota bacterium]|nr:alpha/beta fold hydrolase [Actinomycetota bacterium]
MSFSAPEDLRSEVSYTEGTRPHPILFIHGFTGSPQTLYPQYIRAAKEGYSFEVPQLPGHGTTIEDMVVTRFSDYVERVIQVADELIAKHGSIFVVGISMGGALSIDLALKRPSQVRAMVLINPLIAPPAPSFLEMIDQGIEAGIEIFPAVGSDIKDPEVTEASYGGSPLRTAKSMFEAVIELAPQVEKLEMPILLYNSIDDHVVSPDSGELLVEKCKNLEQVVLKNSFHVATLDFDKEIINDGMISFFDSLS